MSSNEHQTALVANLNNVAAVSAATQPLLSTVLPEQDQRK